MLPPASRRSVARDDDPRLDRDTQSIPIGICGLLAGWYLAARPTRPSQEPPHHGHRSVRAAPRDDRPPRRAGAGPDDERARRADLPDHVATSSTTPQHAADLFALADPGNIYTRIMNPTWDVLEQRLAALEGGVGAVVTASRPGRRHLLGPERRARRRQHRLGHAALRRHLQPLRPHAAAVRHRGALGRPRRPGAVAHLVDENTKLVFGETIGNPRLNVLDIAAWAEAAHAAGLPLILDNTVATPVGRALRARRRHRRALGRRSSSAATARRSAARSSTAASSTGSRTATASRPHGARPELPRRRLEPTPLGPAAYIGRVRTVLLRNTGAALSPFNAFLFLQGIETLPLRMERHNAERARRRAVPRRP